jgi:protein-S-isoprenylcysteine O-methyltransferase Ste14
LNNSQLPQGKLARVVFTRTFVFVVLLLAILFLSAGTFAYWEAWVYFGIILVPMISFLIFLLKTNPELLERRMRVREKQAEQKFIVIIGSIIFFLVFLLPGFDKRFRWSEVPMEMVIVADIFVLLSYLMIFLVLRENRYASRIIEVERDQEVISTGPYAIVRHPMYLGASLMYLFSPLALGSYWAIIPSFLMIPVLVARIRNEEKILERELEGYQKYMQKTKYRLVPGIW